jgi:tRNA threonylcarbamoyladenosine biosynthesis protein TsaB
MILAIRTEKPEAEIALLDPIGSSVDSLIWQAHKELSVTILEQISNILQRNGFDFQDVSGLIVYQGPGSFTGLRIGITVANTFAYSRQVPIVGAQGPDWIQSGYSKIGKAEIGQYVMPEYGGEANITKPRK